MTWWTITKPTVGEATKKQAFADKVIDNLVHLYGLIGGVSAGASGGSLIPNGSFEADEDSDGIPDGWTETEYTAGAGSYETTEIDHGKKAYKFVSPGATGGGDLTTTDFFPVSPHIPVAALVLLKCSVAGVHVLFEFLWYTAAEAAASPSSAAVYDSTANPTSWALQRAVGIPPSNARLAKLRIVGAKNDTATAGTVYFGGAFVHNFVSPIVAALSGGIAEGITSSASWTDVGSATINLPVLSANSLVRITIAGKIKAVNPDTAIMRFRIGTQYSNEISETGTSYIRRTFTLLAFGLSGAQTLYMQLVTTQYGAYAQVPSGCISWEILAP